MFFEKINSLDELLTKYAIYDSVEMMGGKDFVNLTPHPINYYSEDGELVQTIEPSGKIARVSQESTEGEAAGPFSVHEVSTKEVINLPPPEENTYYIVSTAVAEQLKDSGRNDVLVPDTWDYGVRDDKGRIIGTKKFKRIT